MQRDAIEKEVQECEKKFWRALKGGDVKAAMQLTDFPCILTSAQGVGQVDERAFAAMMQNPTYVIHSYDLDDSDMSVRVLSDDVAVVAYRVREKLTVDGKPVTLDAVDSSTWVKRDGAWRCALHTEAISGDPFGRDRTAAS